MIKSKRSNLIMVLSVMVLLTSLLFSIVNITGAWLTDSSGTNKTVNAYIKTSEANLNVYQENSTGTQTRIEKSLPTGYTQLEYIESTGTQYINTGYYWENEQIRVVMDAVITSNSSNQSLFGNEEYIDGTSTRYFSGVPHGSNGKFAMYVGGGSVATVNLTLNSRIYFDMSTTTDKKLNVNVNQTAKITNQSYSASVITNSKQTGTTLGRIYIFANHNSGTNGTSASATQNIGGMQLYAFKMWDNDVLVRNFLPAKNSNGTLGLYDLVEGKFYTNAGTGTFVAGSESLTNTTVSLAYDSSNLTNNKITYGSAVNLKLLLKNEDLGQSFGVRYKVEFYSATASGKVKLNSTISGMTTPTSSSNGFIYNSTDGYYYYQNNLGANVVFEPKTISTSTSKYLMKSFTIAESSSANLFGGNSIYMEISVESINI